MSRKAGKNDVTDPNHPNYVSPPSDDSPYKTLE